MSATPGRVRVRREGVVAWIELDRPPLNVLDRALDVALADAVAALAAEGDVAAIVIDGGKARGFSAGVEVADHVPGRVEGMLRDFHDAIRAVWAADCPVVASVHGFAMGGGFELALACDLVVVESDARLGLPEIRLGAYPPVAAAILPARAGWAMAAELVLGGENLEPARARELGLVNRVCAPGGRRAATDALLAPIAVHSPAVVREAKRALREGALPPEPTLARVERRYLGDLVRLHDAAEGIAAFLEKRSPEWRNR